MPPTLILIRHAEAEHNETKNYSIHDPDLTKLGREQCADLRKGLIADPLAHQAELIITSPMRRTMQTALDTVDWLIEKGVKIQADALWQENSAKPCDVGTAVSSLTDEFPSIDYSTVDPVWPDKTSPAGRQYHYTKSAVVARVSHSGFLRLGVTGCWFFNADYRVFDFAAMASPGSPYQLEQHASTKENGGGLGRSWTEQVILGSDLPDELPKTE